MEQIVQRPQKRIPWKRYLPGDSCHFKRLTKPQAVAALLAVQPFADVIRDYTCHDGEDEAEQIVHCDHLLPLRKELAARPL